MPRRTYPSRHLSISIDRPVHEVYRFVSNPENLPLWAKGLSGSIRKSDGDWIAESPMGAAKARFEDPDDLGVLDHEVTLPTGQKVLNPMRVVPNNHGSDLIFSLFHRPEQSEADFRSDAEAVLKDLQALKRVMEVL